jgi:Uri superfamily endonuclease
VPSSFTPGYYVNIGTMRFGLRYRVARHLVREKKMGIWHVDRLTTAAAATPIGVVMVPWAPWTEHTLNRAVGERLGLSAPIPGFSSADCREDCQAHLWFSAQGITLTALAFAVGGVCATLVHPSTG